MGTIATARLHLLDPERRPEPRRGLCRPDRHRLGVDADARRLHHGGAGRRQRVGPEWHPYLALVASGGMGAVFGVIVGLPALRLRTFYFAMTTLGFATIVTQVALAWKNVTGGGVGTPGPVFPWPFDPGWGFYYFCFLLAALATWMTANIGSSRYGRALVAIRDAEVAAEASGISKPRLLMMVFLLAGALGGVAGGLFSSLQSYITPDAFTFEMSVLFFIGILIGGRGSILGPALGTIILTVLPEIRGTAGAVVDVPLRRAAAGDRAGDPRRHRRPARLQEPPAARAASRDRAAARIAGARARASRTAETLITLEGIALHLRRRAGDRRARPRDPGRRGARPDRPQRQRQDHDAQRRSPATTSRTRATLRIDGSDAAVRAAAPARAPSHRPHLPDAARDRRRLGAGERHDRRHDARPRHLRRIACSPCRAIAATRAHLREAAMLALATVGLELLADVRADRLQHSELRFVEIARALMLRPACLMLDEPAAGLSAEEIRRLGAPDQGDQPRRHRRAAGRAPCRPDLRHLRSRDRAQSRQGAGRRHARRDPLAPGGGQCLPRCLNPLLAGQRPHRPATARSSCCATSRSPSAPARPWRCSAPTAPARPRCCAPCPACCRAPARSASPART